MMTTSEIPTPGRYRMMTLALTLAIFGLGCEHGDLVEPEPPGPDGPTFTQIQTSIFNTSCALSGCHTGTFPPQGLNLSEGVAYSNLVNVAAQEKQGFVRIKPGDPDNSYLFMKITGAAGIAGGRMPLGRTPLSSDQVEMIRAWIENGAPNN